MQAQVPTTPFELYGENPFVSLALCLVQQRLIKQFGVTPLIPEWRDLNINTAEIEHSRILGNLDASFFKKRPLDVEEIPRASTLSSIPAWQCSRVLPHSVRRPRDGRWLGQSRAMYST